MAGLYYLCVCVFFMGGGGTFLYLFCCFCVCVGGRGSRTICVFFVCFYIFRFLCFFPVFVEESFRNMFSTFFLFFVFGLVFWKSFVLDLFSYIVFTFLRFRVTFPLGDFYGVE